MLGLLLCFALAAAPGEAASALADRAILGTLDAMEAAVARADSGAYMALVDDTDPVFAQEQRKWAADLRTRPVETVRLDAAGPARPLDAGGWTVPVTLAWTLPGERAERIVSFDAVFRPIGLPEGAWVYAGRAWETLDADGVRIMVRPGDADAAAMADYLSDRVGPIRASVEAELDERLGADPVVKIYPDMASLQKSIALSYTDPLGGWNEPGESIKLLGRAGFVGPGLDTVLAHELGHAVSFEYGPSIIAAPWWALEGIAEIAADPFRPAARADRAVRMAERGRLMPFGSLADFRGEAMNHMREVYVQGRSMLAYIGERFGRDARNDWLRAMGGGAGLDDATRSVLGLSFDELDGAWRASLAPAGNTDAE